MQVFTYICILTAHLLKEPSRRSEEKKRNARPPRLQVFDARVAVELHRGSVGGLASATGICKLYRRDFQYGIWCKNLKDEIASE